tara:strand:+ start:10790 stop:11128 length:339 start_codon:yes stop_codon:yes gene_type:complete
MANTFKVDTKASVVTAAITDATAVVVTAGGSATCILLSVLLSNKTGTSADVDVYLETTGDDVYLLRNAPVPTGSSLEVISGSKVIMESNDKLRIRCGTASAIDASVSYLEQT